MSEASTYGKAPERGFDARPRLVIRRTYSAPAERLYQAWTDPALLRRWFCPGDLTVPEAAADVRVGGAYMVRMEEPDGSAHVTRGVYREVVPNERLVFTWRWDGSDVETLVTVELTALGEGRTELTLIHEGFPDAEGRDRHRHGWDGCLAKLAAL